MKINKLIFEKESRTIRQTPQNYLIAHFDHNERCWKCVPDLAADKGLATQVFLALFDHDAKWNDGDGNLILSKISNQDIYTCFKNQNITQDQFDKILKTRYNSKMIATVKAIKKVLRFSLKDSKEFYDLYF